MNPYGQTTPALLAAAGAVAVLMLARSRPRPPGKTVTRQTSAPDQRNDDDNNVSESEPSLPPSPQFREKAHSFLGGDQSVYSCASIGATAANGGGEARKKDDKEKPESSPVSAGGRSRRHSEFAVAGMLST